MQDVDLKAILQAVRDTRDGEFVTVEGKDNVRVAKEKGLLVVKVREDKAPAQGGCAGADGSGGSPSLRPG